MGLSIRRASSLALVAALALASFGCGGDTGTQPTTLERTLKLESGVAYPATATAVETLAAPDGRAIQPLAIFSARSTQQVTVWGSRDSSTNVATVYETAYTSDEVDAPVYSKYDAAGNLISITDSDTGSYITFSELDTTDNSIVAFGKDGESGKTASIKAALVNGGVQVSVIDDKSAKESRFVSNAEIEAALGTGGAASRDAAAESALTGFSTVYKGSDDRTKILTAIFRAASLVLDKPFDSIVSDVAGFLLLDQLEESYTTLLANGLTPSLAPDSTTPVEYRADLPNP